MIFLLFFSALDALCCRDSFIQHCQLVQADVPLAMLNEAVPAAQRIQRREKQEENHGKVVF